MRWTGWPEMARRPAPPCAAPWGRCAGPSRAGRRPPRRCAQNSGTRPWRRGTRPTRLIGPHGRRCRARWPRPTPPLPPPLPTTHPSPASPGACPTIIAIPRYSGHTRTLGPSCASGAAPIPSRLAPPSTMMPLPVACGAPRRHRRRQSTPCLIARAFPAFVPSPALPPSLPRRFPRGSGSVLSCGYQTSLPLQSLCTLALRTDR